MPIIDSQQSFLLRRATPTSPRDDRSDARVFALACGLLVGVLMVALPILIVIALH